MRANKTAEGIKSQNGFSAILRRMMRRKTAIVGMVIIVVVILLAVLAPVIAPYGYSEISADVLQGPSWKHPFGTDNLGRDCLSRVLYGAKYSLGLGILAVAIATVFAIIIGSVIGYVGGGLDNIVMRFFDIINAIPNILLCVAIASALGNNFINTVFAMSLSSLPKSVRMVRSAVMSISESEYLEASESVGCSRLRMMVTHVIPNSLAPTVVHETMGIGRTITMAATLSFIGLGIQPPAPEWGAMLSASRAYIIDYPYLCIFPGTMIAIVVLAFNLMGDGLRDAMDPKLKK